MLETASVQSSFVVTELKFMPILKQSWQIFTSDWKKYAIFYVKITALMILVSILVGALSGGAAAAESAVGSMLASLLNTAANFLYSMGIGLGTLMLFDAGSVALPELYEAAKPKIGQYFFTSLELGIRVFVGTILLIVPGVIQALTYGLAPYVILDRGGDRKDAMARSKELTNGKKWQLFGISLLWGLLGAVVLLFTLGFGLLVLAPIGQIALWVTYRTLESQQQN